MCTDFKILEVKDLSFFPACGVFRYAEMDVSLKSSNRHKSVLRSLIILFIMIYCFNSKSTVVL